MDERQLIYRIAFSRIKGMTMGAAHHLTEMLGSEEAMFTLDVREIERRTGFGSHVFTSALRDEILAKARSEAEFVKAHGISVLYYTDDGYPRRLLECEDAPLLIYAKGKCDLNARHCVSIVGTRNATLYGINFINKLVGDLASRLDDLLIISGLALGCDITAHRAAIKAGVPTVGVVAHGLDMIYPAENRNDAARMACGAGMVLTDYPSHTRPFRGNFLARNRIVAGLSDCVVVAESAADHGGALYTARLAQEYNREVVALPGRTSDHYSGGCNKLIRKNVAALCTSADDLIETMGWTGKPIEGDQQPLFREYSDEEQAIIDLLTREGEARVNQITAHTGLPVGKLMGILMELEMEGVIMALPGSRYRIA